MRAVVGRGMEWWRGIGAAHDEQPLPGPHANHSPPKMRQSRLVEPVRASESSANGTDFSPRPRESALSGSLPPAECTALPEKPAETGTHDLTGPSS
jgi:hypothetical protein